MVGCGATQSGLGWLVMEPHRVGYDGWLWSHTEWVRMACHGATQSGLG